MTVHAIALTGLENTAKSFRNELSALMFGATSARPTGARSGVRYGTPTDTVSLSGFDGTVAPHNGIMDVQTSATAGPYFYAVTADENFTVNAAHATLARVDIVTIRIDDDVEDASGFEQATVNYKAGTAAGSPVAPSPDTTRELIIATIAVPASGGGDPAVSWVAPYAVAGGGIIPVRTNTERDALHSAYPGTTDAPLAVWVKSTSKFQYNSGSGWTDFVDLSALEEATGVKHYRWADATARAAQTGMSVGDRGFQEDTEVDYWYSGSAWLANLPGLNLIVPTSVSGANTTVSARGTVTLAGATAPVINGVFTSRFKNYLVQIDLTTSAAAQLRMQLAVGGTPATTAYDNQRLVVASTAATASQVLNDSGILVGGGLGVAGAQHAGEIKLFQPAVAVGTSGIVHTSVTANPMTTTTGEYIGSLIHRTATAYDGLAFVPASGNLTGTIRVYGYSE